MVDTHDDPGRCHPGGAARARDRRAARAGRAAARRSDGFARGAAAVAVLAGGARRGPAALARRTAGAHATAIVVGSKNFTEQVILGEIVAQAIEREGLPVTRKLNLGGTFICDRALRSGDVDVYVEYTGTARHGRLPGAAVARSAGDAAAHARAVRGRRRDGRRAARLQQHVRDSRARRRRRRRSACARSTTCAGWRTAGRRDSATSSCSARTAIPVSPRAYGLAFARPPLAMDLSLIYKALADRRVDVIAGDATSALIDALRPRRARRQPAVLPALRRRAAGANADPAATARGAAGAWTAWPGGSPSATCAR